MFHRPLSLCTVAALALLAAGAQAQSLKVKTGAWESTITSTTTGLTMPPELLAKLTPEQRAKMEQAMGARSGQPHTSSHSYCVTQKDLDEDQYLERGANERCTRKVLSKTGTRVELEQSCGVGPASVSMHVVVQAISPQEVAMTADGKLSTGGTIHTEMRGRWVGATCQGKG